MVRIRLLIMVASAVAGVVVSGRGTSGAQTVQPCPNDANCAAVRIENGTGQVCGTAASVGVSFRQGPATGGGAAVNAAGGGVGEIAALAMTVRLGPEGGGVPVSLADCTPGADDLPAAVKPTAALAGFRLVVENAYCSGGRTHCLCPDAGSTMTPDNFVNLVVYGPHPLPTPGTAPIQIPPLPPGPATLATIDVRLRTGAPETIPVHIYRETTDATLPPCTAGSSARCTAFLSVGDKLAVDQTCVPQAGQPPCSSGSTSQVAVADGVITSTGARCLGDCSGAGRVTNASLLKGLDIIRGRRPLSECNAWRDCGAPSNAQLLLALRDTVRGNQGQCPAPTPTPHP